jgi:hypothetical protein
MKKPSSVSALFLVVCFELLGSLAMVTLGREGARERTGNLNRPREFWRSLQELARDVPAPACVIHAARGHEEVKNVKVKIVRIGRRH